MAVSIRKLCNKSKELYKMKVHAGENGLDNLVQWVHIIEDLDVADMLNGHELVFTTGIGNLSDEERLLEFAKRLKSNNVSGLIINLGPYIKFIPELLIEYCNEVDFPLFSLPWEIKLIDMTRDYCYKILQMEENEKSLISTVKDLIFYPSESEKYIPLIERRGFGKQLKYCVIAMRLEPTEKDTSVDEKYHLQLKFYVEKEMNKISERYITFFYEKYLIVVSISLSKNVIIEFANTLFSLNNKQNFSLYLGVSSNKEDIYKLSESFRHALLMYRISVNKNETPLFYDDAGVYKVLLAVEEKNILTEFCSDTIGALEEFDKRNDTNYCIILRKYIENSARIQEIADEMFVHRNTINYKIKKIKEITGFDLDNQDDALNIALSFKIRDLF